MKSNSRNPHSFWMIAAVCIAILAMFYTSMSPFLPVLGGLFMASFLLPYRFPRDSANIWGIRLLTYALLAVLGRNMNAGTIFYDAQAFTSAGLIAAGEIVLQSWREPPKGLRFDGIIITLSGVMFLIACNTLRYDQQYFIWQVSPIYMATALLALRDLRPRSGKMGAITGVRQYGLILFAVLLGSSLHAMILANRGSLMALGARLLTDRRLPQRAGLGDTSQLSSGRVAPANSSSRMARITGTLRDPHLRAAAFDQYNRGVWTPALSLRKLDSASEYQLNTNNRGPYVSITLMRDTGGQIYAPLNASSILPAYGSSFDWNRSAGPIKTEDPAPYTYFVMEADADQNLGHGTAMEDELPPTFQGAWTVPPTPAEMPALLTVPPEIDPKVRQMAQEITAESLTQPEKAMAITEYLLSHYRYSMDFVRSSQDPVSDFLLNKKPAHCQYFASAAVMLLRSVGIPARYANGYYVHEEDGPGHWIVRTRDAHAWAEAYLDGIGWVVVEATPPDGRADPNVSPVPFYQRWSEWGMDQFSRLRTWLGRLTQTEIIGLLTLIMVLWGLERWRQTRKRRVHFHGPVPPEELAPLAKRFERTLAKRGIELVPEQPWSEAVPSDWEAGRNFVAAYNHARFSMSTVKDLEELQRLLDVAEKTPTASGTPPPN